MSESIGQQLKQAREARYLTIEQVAAETRIRAYYLEAMEADNFERLPSTAQARGFLRLYAEFLGLAVETLIARQKEAASPRAEAAAPAPQAAATPVAPEPPAPEPPAPEPPALKPAPAKKARKVRPARSAADDELLPVPEAAAPAPAEASFTAPLAPPADAPAPRAPSEAQAIFIAIGDELRTRREGLSLNLDEVERHTHVRRHYLQALEAGSFDRLPSSVQARGMLNNYAHFLNLDVDAILLMFADGLQAQLQERQPAAEAEAAAPGSPRRVRLPFRLPHLPLPAGLRRYLTTDLLVGGALILFLVVFAVWGTNQVLTLTGVRTPEPTAPSISDVLISGQVSPTPSPTSPPAAALQTAGSVENSTPVLALPTSGPGAIQIVLVALSSTWVRVTVDGKTQLEGRLTPGSAYPYAGNAQIEVLTGNGGAVSVTYNQNNLGPMGTFGQVVDRIFTLNGILNPTPTSSPTPTVSPVPSITARPSATPRPSSTPRSTP